MANRTHFPMRGRASELVYLSGTFETNSTSAPDGVTGDISSVTRSGVGDYTVTWKNSYKQLDFQAAFIEEDDPDLHAKATGGAITSGTTTVTVYSGAETAADAEAAYTTGVTVTSHTATLATDGYVVYVEATTGTTTGTFTIIRSGTPSTTECTVTYSSGTPTITFAAGDAVTEAAVLVVPTAAAASNAQADSTDKTVRVLAVVRNTALTAR